MYYNPSSSEVKLYFYAMAPLISGDVYRSFLKIISNVLIKL